MTAMKTWQRRSLGILTLGGGATGATITLVAVLGATTLLNWIVLVAFLALYAWGVWCGLRILEAQAGAERSALVYWMLQVPVLGSPLVSYLFANGFHAIVTLQLWPMQLGAESMIGSKFNFFLFKWGTPWMVGVNLFAAGVSVWLARVIRRQRGPLFPDRDAVTD
jgi:hypothetical protein